MLLELLAAAGAGRSFGTGFSAHLLNPKIAVFYSGLLPAPARGTGVVLLGSALRHATEPG